jgi:hypothetical protein
LTSACCSRSIKQPGFSQHFRIFVLASAGRELAGHRFLVSALLEQVRTMLAALDRLEASGYAFAPRRLELLASAERGALVDELCALLGGIVPTSRKLLTHPYSSLGVRYTLWATDAQGSEVPLVDGGGFDWLERLTANRRNVYVASGLGSQLIALRFARSGA